MEKLKEETKNIFNKIEICPRCKNHLEIDIKRERIECIKCGFRIQITSRYNKLKELSYLLGLYALVLFIAFIIAL